ncbi:histidine phosphatase family protein [Paenibacillus sp. PR3]|uniref:Histidine phosphatase family protein n=1 Tax=Paenibacillus terricola TaxID=2763503 RepID=A0ABR8MSD7_9BACL|nr:histidine phosphatase family protein [Paenibacillus terricola]
MLAVAQRIYNLLDEMKETYRDHSVLIVTHGGVCRSNEQFYRFHQGNCEMKEYDCL